LVRKPFPIPKISRRILFCKTALDLNMGYYTIILDLDASKKCTITFSLGKCSYKRLQMCITSSPDMFQAKMAELMESLEYVQANTDDLLCISKGSLEDHLEKLDEVLKQLCDAGLEINAD
jgi:hypothetical protein